MRAAQSRAETGSPEPTRLTVGAWLEAWLDSRKSDLRGGTLASYRGMTRLYVVPELGRVPLRTVTRARLRTLYADLADHGGHDRGPLSPKTIHNVATMLVKVFGDAVEDRLLTTNPAEHAHRLPSARRDMEVWTGPQVAAFLASVAGGRLAALWRLTFSTGMRRGELLGLRWSDVDLEAGALSVQQTRIRGIAGLVYGSPKTAKGRRRIPLAGSTVAALRTHRRAQASERIATGPAWHDEGLVFCGQDGRPLDPDSVSQSFERLAARAGLPRIRFHDARHTAATLLLSAGVHPKVVQERLGHATISTTLDTYSHVVQGLGEDAAERLAAAIDG
jgi:integrase